MSNRVLLDLDLLRESHDFRLVFAGQLVSLFGSQLTVLALAYQIYALTHSSLQVGGLSFAQLPFQVFGSLLGGVLGDRFDRRRMLLVTWVFSALTSGGLAINAAMGHSSVVACT